MKHCKPSFLGLIIFICIALCLPKLSAVTDQKIHASRRTAIVEAVQKVQPSVASIHVVHTEPVYYRYRDPFRDFFSRFLNEILRCTKVTETGFREDLVLL